MENRQKELAIERRAGRGVPVLAFLVGVFLGGLLMALLFAILPSRPPEIARFQSVPAATPVQPMGETEPASTVWREPLGAIGPAGFEPGGSLVSIPSPPPVGASSKWGASGGPCPLLVAGGLLGGCLLGAGAMAWSNRQATSRLEARVRRFEDMAAQHRQPEDWLAELDQNLEGEWNDQR